MKRLFLFITVFFFFAYFSFGQEIGLVLSGGGGKGAYQIGVWKAFCEYGIAQRVSVISGTSVGGLNAALFACTASQEAETLWITEVPSKLTDDESVISQAGLSQIIDALPLETLCTSPFDIYVTAVRARLRILKFVDSSILGNGAGMHAYYFNLNGGTTAEIKNRLLATSAFPVFCDSVWLEDDDGGHYYSDGGDELIGGDNVPIYPIVSKFPHITNIIVVYLSDKNHVSRRIQAKDYDHLRILEIFPSIDLDGDNFFESIIDGTANFSESRIKLLIQKGYEDTCELLKRNNIFPVSSYWFEEE